MKKKKKKRNKTKKSQPNYLKGSMEQAKILYDTK